MTTWQHIAPQLRTILRPPSRPANRQRAALYRPEKALFSYPIAPFLDALVVVDDTLTRRFVRIQEREDWDVTPEFLMRQGLANLDPTAGLQQSKEHDGLWLLKPSDGYASSRLLMPGWMEAFADRCEGQPVAAVPISGMLFIADSAKPEAIRELVVQSWMLYSKEALPISPVPYVPHTGFGLKPWTPELDHQLQTELTRAFLYLAGNEYAAQHPLLKEWAAQQESSPFIAPFFMLKRKGVMGGLTVLPERPSLLPMATWVRKGTDDPKSELPLQDWADLVKKGTICAPEPNWNPPRWSVNPSNESG